MNRATRISSVLRRILPPQWKHRPNPKQESDEDKTFRAFVTAQIDHHAYLEANPDVRAAGFDPAEHWLNHGIYEGRVLARGLVVQRGVAPTHWRRDRVRRYMWRGEAVTISGPLPEALSLQIVAQASHEPAVLAPGALAVPYLRWHEAPDLLARDGVDAGTLFGAVPIRPRAVLVVPTFGDGYAERYGADLIDAAVSAGGGPALVLVTDQTAKQADGWREREVLAAFRDVPVVFWRDACVGAGFDDPRIAANFLHAIRPEIVVVINSRLGLETVARYGRGLSRDARLCCVHFDMGVGDPVGLLGARYTPLTLPFALTVTDTEPAAARLRNLYRAIPGPGFAILPARVQPVSEEVFEARIAVRRTRLLGATRHSRWVVLGDARDVVAILDALAARRPEDEFEAFTSIGTILDSPAPSSRNITIKKPATDPVRADWGTYDGLVCLQQSGQSMELIARMTQHAIVLVLPDVEFLRDTFDDSAVMFVQPGQNAAASATAFAMALEQVAGQTADATVSMIRAAHAQVLAKHAPWVHARAVAQLFSLP